VYFVTPSTACGGTNHNVICRRSLEWWNETEWVDLIKEHLPSFQNGASFPDWAYPLGGDLHDVSEQTHWPPFIKKMAEFIYKNYTKPYTEEAKQLIALLFGIYCHSVADIIWHDISNISPTHQGWIQTLANIEFFNDYNSAHDESDTGGDFYIAQTFDIGFLLDVWYFPIPEMINLYHSLNFSVVSYENIIEGNVLLFAETEAMKRIAREGEFLYAMKSTFFARTIFVFFFRGC